MPLAHCILGKFLGLVCHCFPPPLDVPTFAARCLYVRNDARDPSSERWNCGREICPVILPKFRLPRKFRDFYVPQIYDMGPTALLPLRSKACWGFFRPKNPTALARFEPANLGTKGQHATSIPPKPLGCDYITENRSRSKRSDSPVSKTDVVHWLQVHFKGISRMWKREAF